MSSRATTKLALVLTLASLSALAQIVPREPTLVLDIDESGAQRAWLTVTPVSEPLAQAFAKAVGCPPDAVKGLDPYSRGLHADCPSHLRRKGLIWSAHWDLAPLNAELMRTGAATMEVYITHPRSGFSRVQPAALSQSHGIGLNVSYHGDLALRGLHEIKLETGFGAQQIWVLAGVAGVILLLPLLLIPARSGGPLPVLAAAHGLFCLGATIWLCAILPLNAATLVSAPWSLAITAAPLLISVWTGARIAGGPRRRMYFWRGVRSVAILTLMADILSLGRSLLLWGVCCIAVVLVSLWRLRGAGGQHSEPLAEGELWVRVRQLAARAGTAIKSVHVLVGGEDRPAAFATRLRGVLITASVIRALPRREVDAIIAHELSHVRRPPLATARGAVLFLPAAIVLAFMVPATLPWMPLLLPPGFLIYRAMRRKNERVADADALAWSGDGEALISGLVRVTLANEMPLEWPRWVRLLMPHPSTIERVHAIAAAARIPEERVRQLLAPAAAAPADCYHLPVPSAPAGLALTPAVRARLNVKLSWTAFALPIAFGIAAPFVGFIAAFVIGAIGTLLVLEWILLRARAHVRSELAGRPGVFAGFSPSIEARLYDGSYDYDWGFASFENGQLVFRGDRCSWSVSAQEVERIWLANGPFQWVPRPLVCFRTRSGAAFSLRPFDKAFGPAARRAAARLREHASQWHSAAAAEDGSTPGNFNFASVAGRVPEPYTWQMFLRSLPRYAVFSLFASTALQVGATASNWMNFGRWLSPVLVTWSLALFMACPSLCRSRQPRREKAAPAASESLPAK
ncbi:MAG TPA: M48 family metalloprotease [Bryobacteraceae bacterium]|nr:M48 family metalloprotease [Bryobacteraceae bacterium]